MFLTIIMKFSLFLAAVPVAQSLQIMSYNIMDSGFADDSSDYDPVGDRVPGNLTNFAKHGISPFYDVLGIIETSCWSEDGVDRYNNTHQNVSAIATSWGYEHYHLRDNIALFSHEPINLLDKPSVGYNTIVAEIKGVNYIVSSFSSISYESKHEEFTSMGEYVMKYKDKPLILMGDMNSISPQDEHRYNETLLCGNGTYDAEGQSGEYIGNFCLQDNSTVSPGPYKLDYPVGSLLEASDLTDLCFLNGGFYDIDTDSIQKYSQCGFSNPTLLIHMVSERVAGSLVTEECEATNPLLLSCFVEYDRPQTTQTALTVVPWDTITPWRRLTTYLRIKKCSKNTASTTQRCLAVFRPTEPAIIIRSKRLL